MVTVPANTYNNRNQDKFFHDLSSYFIMLYLTGRFWNRQIIFSHTL